MLISQKMLDFAAFMAEINKAYYTAVAELDALNEENQAANPHNDDDCPF